MDVADLVGRWTLARRLADRRAGVIGTMSGELVVDRDGDGLRWSESGVLRWAGRDVPATRTYLLRDGWVLFADGRPFHPWTPGRPVTHPCRDDVYTGLVTVDGDRLRTLWDVHGPAKHHRLITRFRRAARSC